MEPIKEELEFLTGIKYSGKEYVGIVVNQDNQILTFYDVDTIPNLTSVSYTHLTLPTICSV